MFDYLSIVYPPDVWKATGELTKANLSRRTYYSPYKNKESNMLATGTNVAHVLLTAQCLGDWDSFKCHRLTCRKLEKQSR